MAALSDLLEQHAFETRACVGAQLLSGTPPSPGELAKVRGQQALLEKVAPAVLAVLKAHSDLDTAAFNVALMLQEEGYLDGNW